MWLLDSNELHVVCVSKLGIGMDLRCTGRGAFKWVKNIQITIS